MELKIRNLRKEFKRNNATFDAVKDVDFTVNDHEFVSIIGHSGSGKSTLLNLIAGMLLPSDGEVSLDGKIITGLSDKEASTIRNSVVGYIPQGQSLLSNLTVFDNVSLPFFLSDRSGDPGDKVTDLLSELGIQHLRNSYPNNLSGGEMRRVAIARALVNNPKILLADEPTGDLDKANKEAIVALFRKIADSGTAVIMVTHDLETVKTADTNFIMDEGTLSKDEESASKQPA
ncbi:MAG: ABC transporter ATP-binding protein [Lachnospiraceae bacterium]|nr:ABC transporter ATP-binding protein [Lachnospiraceae bacterium]